MINKIKLELKNRQKEISFDEEHHTYLWKGEKFTSVTQFIKQYSHPFDPSGKILERCAKREGLTGGEMQAKWDTIKDESCHRGTLLHNYLEKRMWGIKGLLPLECTRYVDSIKKFMKWIDAQSWELVDTEVILYNTKWKLAGQVDLLMMDKETGELIVPDYKSNKEISLDNKYNQYMTSPFESIPDTSFGHYSMQLNIYAKMLEAWGFKVSPKKILLHFDKDEFHIIDTSEEVNKLITSIDIGKYVME